MPGVRIVTDSTCDLPPELAQQYGIHVVPIQIHINDDDYLDGVDLSVEEFHRRLATWPSNLPLPTTTHTRQEVFEDLYKQILKEGESVISIHHSAKLGGTFASAVAAKNSILAPTTQIAVIDSLTASFGLGIIAIEAAKRARKGAHHVELVRLINRMIYQTHVIFFTDTLTHITAGGRIGKAQAALGATPSNNFRPLLRLEDGLIVPFERTRTRTKAIEGLCEFIEDFPHIDEMAIMHSNSASDVDALLTRIAPVFPREKVFVGLFSPVLATHLGPGAMGVTVYEGGIF
ncbi:DegV family protein [Candidatus Chlorohelix sp.]|uniref:DegV family protein n=1 Tax=Candidatus Chlorohelix sp. TaxID=3139201 RepID=UPI0030499D27